MRKRKLSHIQIIALGFFIIISTGTFLLMLPIATRAPGGANFIDALLTATSASCVTGLIRQDTSVYWSLFGQIVIISLIQLGGLGFMTVAVFLFKMINRNPGLRERAVMAESINTTKMSGMSKLTHRIIMGTAIFEIAGAALLSIRFIPIFGVAKGIYVSIFHSISAFCNAGFDIMGYEYGKYSSLTAFSNDALVNIVIMLLITIGGLGFLVWDDIAVNKFRFRKYRLHTKFVLVISGSLILIGALLLLIFEWNNLCRDMPWSEKILTSFFGSVTPRTAGFNSTDTAALTQSSKLLTIILMFIGGSSGSTAGGIKTTSFGVIVLLLVSSFRGEHRPHCFGRSISDEVIKKAILIIAFNLFLAFTGTMIICAIDNVSLTDAVFETFSAIGTVGMTTGITRELSAVSCLIISFLMYCGRVGSISFAVAVLERKAKPPVAFPNEEVSIG